MARGRRGGGGAGGAKCQIPETGKEEVVATDTERRPPSSLPPPRPASEKKDTDLSGAADPEWIKSIRESAERAAEAEFSKKAAEMWKMAETMMQQMEKQQKETSLHLEQEVRLCREKQQRMEEERAVLERGVAQLQERLNIAEHALQTGAAIRVGVATEPYGWTTSTPWFQRTTTSWNQPPAPVTLPGPPGLEREVRTPPPLLASSGHQSALYPPVPKFPFASMEPPSVIMDKPVLEQKSRTLEPATPPKTLEARLESSPPSGQSMSSTDKLCTPKSTPKFRPRVSTLGVLPELSELPMAVLPPPGLEEDDQPKSPKATSRTESWVFKSPKLKPTEAPQIHPQTPGLSWPGSSMRKRAMSDPFGDGGLRSPPDDAPSTPQRVARVSLLGSLTPMKTTSMSPMRQSSLMMSPMKSPMMKSPAVPASPFVICEGGGVIFGFQLRRADGVALGIDYQLVSTPEQVDAIIVTGIQPGSAIEAWNKQCAGGPAAGKAVHRGDKIVSVNCRTEALDMIPELESRTLVKLLISRDDHDWKLGGAEEYDSPTRPLAMRAEACPFVPAM